MTMTAPFATDDLDTLSSKLSKRKPVCAVIWDGHAAFGKLRTSLRAQERMVLGLAPVIRRWLARDLPFSPKTYSTELPVEVQRLKALHSAGYRVPEVLAANSKVLVTAHAGVTLGDLLHDEPDDDARLVWLLEAARDLAAFHRAGQWHGAAQIRNVVRMRDGQLGRIDFETALDGHFPLALLQAFDASLFFSSLARTRDVQLLPAVSRAYLADAPESAKIALRRGFPLVRRLSRSRLMERLSPKETERLRAIASLPL